MAVSRPGISLECGGLGGQGRVFAHRVTQLRIQNLSIRVTSNWIDEQIPFQPVRMEALSWNLKRGRRSVRGCFRQISSTEAVFAGAAGLLPGDAGR